MYNPKTLAVCATLLVLLGLENILHKRRLKRKKQDRQNNTNVKSCTCSCHQTLTHTNGPDSSKSCKCACQGTQCSQQNGSKVRTNALQETGNLPGGLVNLRTMCFFNATIQAISSSDHFLLSLHPLNTTTPLAQSLYTLCASINERRSRHHVHVSTHVANAIHSNARLVQGTQQDAHELFLVLLDRLDAERGASNVRKEVLGDGLRLVLGHSRPGNAETRVHGESVREFRGQLRPESLNGVCPGLQARAGAFAKGQKEQDSAMMGLLASHLACQMCGGQFQIRVDPFRDLSLPLPVDTASVSLRACLSTYFEPQVISDYWCWRCSALEAIETHADMLTASERTSLERCTRSTVASEDPYAMQIIETLPRVKNNVYRYVSIARMPRVLCLHINRLQYHAALGRLYKSRCSLTFEDTLTLPYAVSSKHPPHQTPRTSTLTFTGGSTHTHSRTYADMAHTMRYAGMPGYSALGRQERGEASEEGRSGSGSGNVRYKLVAVMVHQGGDLGGHFYTYRRLPVQRPIRMATSGCTDTHSSSQFTFELSENTNMRTAEHTVQPTAPPAAPDVVSHTSAYTLGHGTPHTPQTTTQRTPTHTTHHKTAAHPAPHTPQSTTQRTPTHNTHHTTAAHPAPQATTAPGLTCTSGACEEPGTSGDACASKQRHTTRSKKEPSSVGQARGSADSTTHTGTDESRLHTEEANPEMNTKTQAVLTASEPSINVPRALVKNASDIFGPNTDTNIHTGTQAPSAKALNAFADGEDTDHSTREDDVGDEWYLVSDETVRRVEFSTVQADSAYMLLYERI